MQFDYRKLFGEDPVIPGEEKPVVQTPEAQLPGNEPKPETAGEVEPQIETNIEKVMDRFAEKIVSAIGEASKYKEDTTHLKTMFSPKSGMQGIQYPEGNIDNLPKNDKILLFFKSLVNRHSDPRADHVFKALIEGTDSQGGYLVPEEWRTEVFRCLRNFAVMRQLARVIPMRTDTMNLNTLAARPAAYWTAEYASKSTTSAEFGRVTLSPNDLVCLIPVTHQLLDDANIDVIRFITELFAETIAEAEDKAFFVGSGSGQPQGLSSCSGILTHNAGGVLDFDDMITVAYKIPQRHRNSASCAWVASRKVIEILRKVKDSNYRYIWLPSGIDDVTQKPMDMILGHRVYEQNDVPEDQIFFGDFSMYAIGDRQSMTVETTREGGDAWRRNATEIKAVERVDGKCILGCAFVKVSGIQS